MLLLCTVPGERLMRPDYGSLLHRLAFAPNDATTAGLAIHYVRQALRRWEPRIEVLDVDAEADPDVPSQLGITLRYRVRASLTVDTLAYPLDLDGGTTG
jgi:phage baseplate assembly protein W